LNVFCLGSDQIDDIWPRFAEHIYRLERLDLCSAEEVRAELKAARKQLWGLQDGQVITGVAITEIKGRTCDVWGACGSGSYKDMAALLDAIEQWAQSIHCERMKIQGRRGWARLFKEYRQTGVILEKELVDGI
jgi:hypothetical protein